MSKNKIWKITYCDFRELDFQYNCCGLLVTADLLDRLSEATAQKECQNGLCEVSISGVGEPILEAYAGDPTVVALNDFAEQLESREDLL